jgi:mono/diheme cytochrome c family protein
MNDIDQRLAAIRTATEKIAASDQLKKQLVARLHVAAALPVTAGIGWYVGAKLKILFGAVLLAGAGAALVFSEMPVAHEQTLGSDPVPVPARVNDEARSPTKNAPTKKVERQHHDPATPPSNGVAIPIPIPKDEGREPATAQGKASTDSQGPAPQVAMIPLQSGCGGGRPVRVNLGAAPPPQSRSSQLERVLSEVRRDLDLARANAEAIPNLVVYGRLIAEDQTVDPGTASGHLRVLPGGWFVAAIGSRALPLWITLHGHQPVALQFGGLGDGEVFVGYVILPKATGVARASIQVTTEPFATMPDLTLSIGTCDPVNTPTGHFERSTRRMFKATALTELSLAPYRLTAKVPGHETQSLEISPTSHRPNLYNLKLEKAAPLSAEYVVGNGVAQTATVQMFEPWQVFPGCAITLEREGGLYSITSALGWEGQLLGVGTLGDFRTRAAGGLPVSPVLDVWKAKCSSCHGRDGSGDTRTGRVEHLPDMRTREWRAAWSDERIREIIREGSPANRKMKPFKEKLSPEEIEALIRQLKPTSDPTGPFEPGQTWLLQCASNPEPLLVRFSKSAR